VGVFLPISLDLLLLPSPTPCTSHLSYTGTFDQKLLCPTRTYVYISKYVYIFMCIWIYIEEPESSRGAPQENTPEKLLRRILLRSSSGASSSGATTRVYIYVYMNMYRGTRILLRRNALQEILRRMLLKRS